jgi:hypothetical protein
MILSGVVTIRVVRCSTPVLHAARALSHDLRRALGAVPDLIEDAAVGASVAAGDVQGADRSDIVVATDSELAPEAYRISTRNNTVVISGGDDLGVVFGIYRFSHDVVGVDPYHHLTGKPLPLLGQVDVADLSIEAAPPAVRYRGVFFNDVDLLSACHREPGIRLSTWRELFETVLRLGYNMVIPANPVTPQDDPLESAHEMGLWITHHHVEPLGAEMFGNRYPGEVPRFPEDRDRLEVLYREAVEAQREFRVVWTLGFRGQGDVAFYESDNREYSPAERGGVISKVIELQKQIVDEVMDEPQEFVHYVYAESAWLLERGHLVLPTGVLPVYADNGYGAMRMRRQGLEPEEHISSMPPVSDDPVGLYYHVQFHDLQAAGKLISTISPEVITTTMDGIFNRGPLRYAVNNVSSVRSLLYPTHLVARMWWEGAASPERTETLSEEFLDRYVPECRSEAKEVLDAFYRAPARFGEYPDQKAGEQLYHDPICAAIRAALRGESTAEWFQFLGPSPGGPVSEASTPGTLVDALARMQRVLEPSRDRWRSVCEQSRALISNRQGFAADFLYEFLDAPATYMAHCNDGALRAVASVAAYLRREYQDSFIEACAAHRAYTAAWRTLLSRASGRFQHLYRGEWLTDTRETIRNVRTLMGMARTMGDWRKDWWRSEWVLQALRPSRTAASTISQASLRYATLGEALERQRECATVDFLDILLEEETEPDD